MAQIIGTNTVTNGLVFALDAANNKSRSANTFLAPKDPFAWFGLFAGNNCTISRDDMLSPNGGKCVRMDVTGSDPHTVSWGAAGANIVRAAAGETWTASCWVKGAQSGGNVEGINLFEANAAGANIANTTGSTPSIGTSWTRITTTRTFTDATTVFAQLRLDGPSPGTGQTYWWADFQLEKSASASAFNPTINTGNATVVNMADSTACTSANITYSTTEFSFNGTNSYMTITPLATFTQTSTLSFEAWVNHTSSTQSVAFIGGAGDTGFNGWWLGIVNTTNIGFNVGNGTVAVRAQTTKPSTNTTFHVVGTYDGSNAHIYVNGALAATQALTGPITYTGITNMYIGQAESLISARYWTGKIFATRFYNRTLTAEEVTQNFNQTRGRFGV